MINDAKTDFLIIGTRQQLEKTSIESIIIGDTVIKPLESVRNLESWFDAHMRMKVYIGKICFSRTIQHKTDQKIPYRAIHKDTDPCLCIFPPSLLWRTSIWST